MELCDGAGSWQPAVALLDTGNEHCTCIDEAHAVSLGLYDPRGSHGGSGGVHASATGVTTLRGIVPGATVEVPLIHVRLRVRGMEFGPLAVAVTTLERQRPVLLGMDVIGELFSAGFHLIG